jgi:hypothetical protein
MCMLFSSLKITNQVVFLNRLTLNILLLETVKYDTIVIQHINTKVMLADSLTKALPPTLYKEHVVGMNLHACMDLIDEL